MAETPNKPAPKQKFMMMSPMMLKVVYATIPIILFGIYSYGWKVLALATVSLSTGIFVEWLMARKRNAPVHSSVLVSCLLFTLTLPPNLPLWIAAVGIAFGILFGKEVFGGFGRNAFNPALVGRCFIYVCFPAPMTTNWNVPFFGGSGALSQWTTTAFTGATPLKVIHSGNALGPDWTNTLLWNRAGSIGEISIILILLAAAYLLITKTANWRLMLSCALGTSLLSAILWATKSGAIPDPLTTLALGGILFGTVFMVTDPVSACNTTAGMWIYGSLIGIVTVLIRGYSNFSGGIMFAILFVNMFAPTIDIMIRGLKPSKPVVKKQELK